MDVNNLKINAYDDFKHFFDFMLQLRAWSRLTGIDLGVRTSNKSIIFSVMKKDKVVRRVFKMDYLTEANFSKIEHELGEAYLELADKF